MIDETRQEQASLYVLRMLPPAEALAFARELERDPELQALVAELEATAAAVSLAAPAKMPPPELKERIFTSLRAETKMIPFTARPAGWIPWALAACAALTATVLWLENRSLNQELQVATSTLHDLRGRDGLAAVRIASLSAKVAAYEKALATVVYDPRDQRGLVKLNGFPKPASGKDYQLWVIEPGGAAPVSAGVVPVDAEGFARISFRPHREVQEPEAFAISVEPSGGSPSPQGEIVFVGK